MKTAIICCFSLNETRAFTKNIQVASWSRLWHFIYTFLRCNSRATWNTFSGCFREEEPLWQVYWTKNFPWASQQMVFRWDLSSTFFWSSLFLPQKHTWTVSLWTEGKLKFKSKIHDLNFLTSFSLVFAMMGGSPERRIYRIIPQLQMSDFDDTLFVTF